MFFRMNYRLNDQKPTLSYSWDSTTFCSRLITFSKTKTIQFSRNSLDAEKAERTRFGFVCGGTSR